MEEMQLVLITGLSGAGKSQAVDCFEDLGYFCVDNLPPTLIPKVAELCMQSEGKINRVALVCDIRGRDFFTHLIGALDDLEGMGLKYEILFLDADVETLVRRYKETRRRHPLNGSSIMDAISREGKIMSEIRGKADNIINTSHLSPADLKERIANLFSPGRREKNLFVTLVSFGYKYTIPLDADLVFDVRFLPNPFYVENLRDLPGTDSRVKQYLWKWSVTHRLLQKLRELLDFLLPYYVREGKSHLIIAIGCTGGKHRSVVMVNELAEELKEQGYTLSIEHRDLEKSVV